MNIKHTTFAESKEYFKSQFSYVIFRENNMATFQA